MDKYPIAFRSHVKLYSRSDLTDTLVRIIRSYVPKGYNLIGYSRASTSESHYFAVANDRQVHVFRISSHNIGENNSMIRSYVTRKYDNFTHIGQEIRKDLINKKGFNLNDNYLLLLYALWKIEQAKQSLFIDRERSEITLLSESMKPHKTIYSKQLIDYINNLLNRSILYTIDNRHKVSLGVLGRRMLDYYTVSNRELFYLFGKLDIQEMINILNNNTKGR